MARCKELYHDLSDAADIPPRRRFLRVVIGLAAVIHGGARLNPRRHQAKDVDIGEASRRGEGDPLVKAVADRLRQTERKS